MAMIDERFPQAMKEKRMERLVTLKELSEKTGVAQSQLSEIETGKKTGGVMTLVKIAKALKLDLNSIYEIK